MSNVRTWAVAHNVPVGKRGRISREVFVAYLQANPAEARAYLREHGLTVGKRGRISKADIRRAVIG